MSNALPKALSQLIEALSSLPGVGPRTAERYAYYLLRAHSSKADNLAQRLSELHAGVKYCPKTYALIDAQQELSPLYTNPKRNKKLVAVVADPFDIIALEKTSAFDGTYHVLGGLISPIEGIGPEELTVRQLVQRIKDDKVVEVILATNASVEGESTALYLQQQLKGHDVKVTRLARGLPIGLDLEYADQITLGRAIEGRQAL